MGGIVDFGFLRVAFFEIKVEEISVGNLMLLELNYIDVVVDYYFLGWKIIVKFIGWWVFF